MGLWAQCQLRNAIPTPAVQQTSKLHSLTRCLSKVHGSKREVTAAACCEELVLVGCWIGCTFNLRCCAARPNNNKRSPIVFVTLLCWKVFRQHTTFEPIYHLFTHARTACVSDEAVVDPEYLSSGQDRRAVAGTLVRHQCFAVPRYYAHAMPSAGGGDILGGALLMRSCSTSNVTSAAITSPAFRLSNRVSWLIAPLCHAPISAVISCGVMPAGKKSRFSSTDTTPLAPAQSLNI